jgi:hypothetical protein
METITIETNSIAAILTGREQELCPFHSLIDNTCTAALSSFTTDGLRRAGYCQSENFDSCALFLSKTLRKR